ncbi:hypothetical protein [Jiangella alba]|uniref:Uncharacterized protein n=1 Tax=Jiangella alba TaxID=561176 RepID=A0A1H5J6X7_9ACTN|nr:hypothetical protein [Jiangella alba]SEE48246.1 hypothetical protein SAMN04488561_1465 [Jiangella alba]
MPTTDDQYAVDAIATLLGTSAEWNSSMFEDISDIVGAVRPHPGDAADTYGDDFRKVTGREVLAAWDLTDDQDDREGSRS